MNNKIFINYFGKKKKKIIHCQENQGILLKWTLMNLKKF